MLKTKTPQQINKILDTFRKNDKEVYNNILQLADQMGVATKSAFKPSSKRTTQKIVTESKSKQKDVQRLYARISRDYGATYTEYKRRKKKRYERYKQSAVDAGQVPLKRKSWEESRSLMNNLTQRLFKFAIDSDEARDVVIVAENIFSSGDEETALNYLRRQVERFEKDARKAPDNPF